MPLKFPPLRRFREPLPLQDFSTYDDYWSERGGEPIVHPRWEIAVRFIHDGDSVLDVGCGQGGFMSYLRDERPACKVQGTDISAAAVDSARAAGHDAFQCDLTLSRLKDRYDVITCFETIEHIADAESVLQNMRDACRRTIIMSLPNIGFIEHRIRLGVFGRFPNTNLKFHVKEHIRHWTVADFRHWAATYGLTVRSVHGQYGSGKVPWQRYPGLFSRQLVYVLQPSRHTD